MPATFEARPIFAADDAPIYHESIEPSQAPGQETSIPATKVVMLVYNPCVNDSRVIREAEALVEAGYEVTVLAKRAQGVPIRETRNGVDYRRVLSVADRWHPQDRRMARLINYFRRDPYRSTWRKKLIARAIAAINANNVTRSIGSKDSGSWASRFIFWSRRRTAEDAADSEKDVGGTAFRDRYGWVLAIASIPLLLILLPIRLAMSGLKRSAAAFQWLSVEAIPGAGRFAITGAKSMACAIWSRVRPALDWMWRVVKPPLRPIARRAIPALRKLKRPLKRAAERGVHICLAVLRRLHRAVKLSAHSALAFATRLVRSFKKLMSKLVRSAKGAALAGSRASRRLGTQISQRIKQSWRSAKAKVARKITITKSRTSSWVATNIRKPLWLRFNSLVSSAFIFEVVDIAMRRQLLRLRPDIIHAHDLMTLPTASRAAQDVGARLVYDSHELEMHRNAAYSPYSWRRRGRMEKQHIRRTDLVITVSESIADHLRDAYRIPQPKVVMNTPPLDVRHSTVKSTIRRTLGLRRKTPLAIYVGSVTINRGIEMCVRALAQYPELHFATIGPRRKPNEIELLEIAAAEGVMDRFHMIDPVPADAVVSFVRDADVSVLPIQNVCLSYYYCMPNKLFESVIGGLPVAVADLVELRKFVERYRCGVIMDETDPQDVARAIRQVIESRNDYILGDSDLEEVRAKYTWPAQAQRLVDAYSGFRKPVANGSAPAIRVFPLK